MQVGKLTKVKCFQMIVINEHRLNVIFILFYIKNYVSKEKLYKKKKSFFFYAYNLKYEWFYNYIFK